MSTATGAAPADAAGHRGDLTRPGDVVTTDAMAQGPPTDQDPAQRSVHPHPNPAPVRSFTAFLLVLAALCAVVTVGMEVGWFG